MNELYKCAICLDQYDECIKKPTILYPCFHTFCLACVERIKNVSPKKCATCRGIIENVGTNYALYDIIESNSTQVY
jgi:hypothetical protein